MTEDLWNVLRAIQGVRPPPAFRKKLAEAFSLDAAGAWNTYAGTDDWLPLTAAREVWPTSDLELLWAPIADQVKGLLTQLKKRTLGLMARRWRGSWQMGYILEMGTGPRQYYHLALWVGGAPNAAPKAPKNGVDGEGDWSLPDDLERFYAIHDGFGPHFDGVFPPGAVMPSALLEYLPAVIGHRTKDRSAIIQKSGFLSFLIRDDWNRLGFYRQGRRAYTKAFEWDHETKSAIQRQAGLAVINRTLAAKLRE